MESTGFPMWTEQLARCLNNIQSILITGCWKREEKLIFNWKTVLTRRHKFNWFNIRQLSKDKLFNEHKINFYFWSLVISSLQKEKKTISSDKQKTIKI